MSAQAYRIDVHRTFEAVGEPAWNTLHAASGDRSVFQTWGWVTAWWRTSAPLGAELALLSAYDHQGIVAIAPLYLQQPTNDVQRARLRFLGGFHNDYQMYLVHPDHTGVYAEFHRHVLTRMHAHEIELNEVPRRSALDQWLVQHGRHAVQFDPTPCPMLSFDRVAALDTFINKKSIRRKRNKLNGQGTVDIEHITERAAIRQALPTLFEQHQQRWDGTGFPSLFRRERARAFYLEVVDALPQGVPVFTRVLLNGRTIACHLGFRSDNDLLWYKPAFDVAFAPYSPGELMITSLICYAHEQGFAALDFTRGDEAFKSRFSNVVNWNDNHVVYRSPARFALTRGDRLLRVRYRQLRDLARRPTRSQGTVAAARND
jgi:CelD/BcsL family acetyltransferase involved in cellulose biosynthesis